MRHYFQPHHCWQWAGLSGMQSEVLFAFDACRPTLKRQMDYCMDHPEEISKMASVQRKVLCSRLLSWLFSAAEGILNSSAFTSFSDLP
jgi:hypothetical protein